MVTAKVDNWTQRIVVLYLGISSMIGTAYLLKLI